MSGVRVFPLTHRSGSKHPWQVRWRLDHRDASRQFRTKAAAERFRARLLIAADSGEPFDPATKLPRSWADPAPSPATAYTLAANYLARKWAGWAPASRRSAVQALTPVVIALTRPSAPLDSRLRSDLHRWLSEVALIDPPPGGATGDRCRDDRDRTAHTWLTHHSLPATDIDTAAAESILDVLARRGDGAPAAAPVTTRKITLFRAMLKHGVRSGALPADPLANSDWRRPLIDHEVHQDQVMSLDEVTRLLQTVPRIGRLGPRLVAFFATLYYAGLRTGEALALTDADLTLPEDGVWGQISVRASRTTPGPRYTDTGAASATRQLKWRAVGAVRHVPIPPQLVVLLRQHLSAYPVEAGQPMFTNTAGRPLAPGQYTRVFTAAKQATFNPDSPLQRTRPYDLRHANATLLLNADVGIPDAARRLGHSPEVLLRVYAGVTAEDQHRANRSIDEALSSAANQAPVTRAAG